LVFCAQDWWDAHLESGGYGFWLSYVPKVLLAVVIALMDEAYFKVAVWLNDLGMYPNDNRPPTLGHCSSSILSLFFPLSPLFPLSHDMIVSPCELKYETIADFICRLLRIDLCILRYTMHV